MYTGVRGLISANLGISKASDPAFYIMYSVFYLEFYSFCTLSVVSSIDELDASADVIFSSKKLH